jgi:hypothetical protein
MLYGEDAVETYTWFELMTVDIEPWLLYEQVTDEDNARNARVAAHLATLIDANGLFCGWVEADMDRLARLGEPLPTTPPPGSVEEYVVWAKGSCDSAERAIAECINGMAALEARYSEEGAAFEETEADRWGLYGTLHRALGVAEAIERRSEVPSEGQALHALVVEMAGEIDTAISTLGVVGPVDDPETDEEIGTGQDRVAELCAEIKRQADAMRKEHAAR